MSTSAVVAVASAPRDIVLVYNRYLVELLVILKTHGGPAASRALTAARHRAVDASSDAYIRHAIARDLAGLVTRAEDVLDATGELMSSDVLLAGLPLADLLLPGGETPLSGGEAGHSRALIHILATLAAAHAPDEQALEKQTLAVIARLQKPAMGDAAGPGALLEAVLEDDVRGLLELCRKHLGPSTPDDIEKMLESSKLGAFAREMLDDIGPDALVGLTKDPATAFDLAQITDENSPIGSIVKKAGSKLVAKLTSGELNKDELITDLVKMMGAFGGDRGANMPNGMSDVMTTMTGMLQGLQQQSLPVVSKARQGKPRR